MSDEMHSDGNRPDGSNQDGNTQDGNTQEGTIEVAEIRFGLDVAVRNSVISLKEGGRVASELEALEKRVGEKYGIFSYVSEPNNTAIRWILPESGNGKLSVVWRCYSSRLTVPQMFDALSLECQILNGIDTESAICLPSIPIS